MPKGDNWIHEIKFDGYRTLAYIENGEARMYTRTGLDWTEKFGNIPKRLALLNVNNAIIDGEIVVSDENGITSFKKLQEGLKSGEAALEYYAFDLLYLNGQDLRKETLLDRKALLKEMLKKMRGHIHYSEHFSTTPDLLSNACQMGLEGLISKRGDATYHSGRGKNWLKNKCHKRQEFVIGGFTEPAHKERGIGALLLGYYEDGVLRYGGKCGTGFDHQSSYAIRKKLDALEIQSMAFEAVPTEGRRGAHWVKPQLVCEVEFTEWTTDGYLRHPSFQGMREDKPAKNIKREEAMPIQKVAKETAKKNPLKKSSREKPLKSDDALVGGIRISHPERVIYPGTDITKLQLAEYYYSVADVMLPHIAKRPLSMVRCPEGSGKPCFFQRHIAKGQSPDIHEAGVPVKGRQEEYVMIKDTKGLISLIQWGVIELHPWGCLADKPDLPDRIIFDLDPDPGISFSQVVEGVKEVKLRMEELGLQSFLKTTGGKGLHVVVPITRKYSWPTIKAFARAIATSMQTDNPSRYIATASKAQRKGKIFVDYLRNDLTSTAVAPYSARAREGASVATPLEWSELKVNLNPRVFTIETLAARLQKKDDPWEEMLQVKQQISARILRALKIPE